MREENKLMPEEFRKVIKDFVKDISLTFPEYNCVDKHSDDYLFEFCKKKLPPRFFDILYQNDEIFKEDSEIDTEFLPNINFKNLWQCDISKKTRDIIWKYLQLILISIVSTLQNKDEFGDTAKMFEAINETEFKEKLQETMKQMQGIFDLSGNSENFSEKFNMPDSSSLYEHISGMLEGKLGQLAQEIAEETASYLEFDETTDIKDIFHKLIKNPSKLMELVKKVGNKLDSKIKSGDIKESELILEATEMMNKMKNIPGMENILSKMGGGAKVNTAAMESKLNQKMKLAQMKERIKAKAFAKAVEKETKRLQQEQQQEQNKEPLASEEELIKLFSSGITGPALRKTSAEKTQNQQNKKNKKNK